MNMRFEEAGGNSGIWPRLFGSFYLPFARVLEAPLLGYGLGLGTNAGSQIAFGRVNFSMGEDDWSRVIMESGPLVGLLFIGWRLAVVVCLARVSISSFKAGNALPLFLFGASALFILQGQIGQPTILGFASLVGGICLAAANGEISRDEAPPSQDSFLKPSPVTHRHPRRGRSVYAEALHGRSA